MGWGGLCVCVNQNSAEEQRILPDTHQALCLTSNIFPFLSSQLLIFHEKASQDIFFFFFANIFGLQHIFCRSVLPLKRLLFLSNTGGKGAVAETGS